MLNRDSQGVTLYGRGRDIYDVETAMSLDRTSGQWSMLGDATDVRRSDERKVIAEVIGNAEEPISPAEIAATLGLPTNNVKQLLFKMAKNGEVEKAGRGNYVTTSYGPPNLDNPITNGAA